MAGFLQLSLYQSLAGGAAQLVRMITDVQLAIFADMLGMWLFLFVLLHHYARDPSGASSAPGVQDLVLGKMEGVRGLHSVPSTHRNIQSSYTWMFPNDFCFLRVFLNPMEQEAATE